jgi:D-cysteine desulfhydrase
MIERLRLAHLPTPLVRYASLDALVGAELWVKRDDMSGGPEAGNKIRKLEYLFADALARGASYVVTCGGLQSNHARATALLAARLGLSAVLLLRSGDGAGALAAPTGNLLLDRLAGAELRIITPDQYRERDALMADVAAELRARGETPYVVPEGGSNGRGALGYVEAMREVRRQLELGLAPGISTFDAVVHACGSGGTAAGVVLGSAEGGVAPLVYAIAVCDDRAYFEAAIERICREARELEPSLQRRAELVIEDRYKGPAYGVASDEQRRFLVDVARRSGLVLDPVYTGKALFGLARLEQKPRRVLFLHTGGLPGLLAQASELEAHL